MTTNPSCISSSPDTRGDREIPNLQTYRREFGSRGFEILGVSFDDERSKLEAFLAASELSWEQIHAIGAQRERIASELGSRAATCRRSF